MLNIKFTCSDIEENAQYKKVFELTIDPNERPVVQPDEEGIKHILDIMANKGTHGLQEIGFITKQIEARPVRCSETKQNSWQAMLGIVEALGEYGTAWQKVDLASNAPLQDQIPQAVKKIGTVLARICQFCYFEEICFEDIIKNSQKKLVDKSLIKWSGKLAAAYLGATKEKNNQYKSDICNILKHIVGILELQASILGSNIEIVESDTGTGVVVWTSPVNKSIQIKVFVANLSKINDKAKYANDARTVMIRRIEDLMREAGEWSNKDDLHDCVLQVLDEKNEWKDKAEKLACELDALKAMHAIATVRRAPDDEKCPKYLQQPSRKVTRRLVVQFLQENTNIFMKYGVDPVLQTFDHTLWLFQEELKQKILTKIIPNNQIILGIIDANKVHLTNEEYEVVEAFRIYAANFESKYCHGKCIKGKSFPSAINHVFA